MKTMGLSECPRRESSCSLGIRASWCRVTGGVDRKHSTEFLTAKTHPDFPITPHTRSLLDCTSASHKLSCRPNSRSYRNGNKGLSIVREPAKCGSQGLMYCLGGRSLLPALPRAVISTGIVHTHGGDLEATYLKTHVEADVSAVNAETDQP